MLISGWKQLSVFSQLIFDYTKNFYCNFRTGKVEGIQTIVQIAETSPQALNNDLHAIVMALLNECKNLRSSVSRVAIVALGRLFSCLNTKMDSELDKVFFCWPKLLIKDLRFFFLASLTFLTFITVRLTERKLSKKETNFFWRFVLCYCKKLEMSVMHSSAKMLQIHWMKWLKMLQLEKS